MKLDKIPEFEKRMRFCSELLYAEVKVDLPKYQAVCNRILDDLKQRYPGEFASVSLEMGMKPLEQVLEKAKTLYRWDITKLADLVRARIVVKSTDQIQAFFKYLEGRDPGTFAVVKNHFAEPTDTGYRNVWMSLKTELFPQIEFCLEQEDMLKASLITGQVTKKLEKVEFDIAGERAFWLADTPDAEGDYQYYIFGQYIPVRALLSHREVAFTEAPSFEDDGFELAMKYMRAIRNDEDIVRVDRDKFLLYCKHYRARRNANLYAFIKKYAGKDEADEMKSALTEPSDYGEKKGIVLGARTFEEGAYKDRSLLHYEIASDGTLVFLFDSTKVRFKDDQKGIAIPIKPYKKATMWKVLLPETPLPTLWDGDADCRLMKAVRRHFKPKAYGGTDHKVVFAVYEHLLDFVEKLGLLKNAVTQKIT